MDYTDKEENYELMVHYIKATPVETLSILYDVKADIEPMSLFLMLSFVTLSHNPQTQNEDRWELSFRIPSANRYREEFWGPLKDIIIRIKVYLLWANSEDGKLAIKKYLDH